MDGGESLICNLGCETGYSVKEVIDVALEVSGRTFEVVEAPRRPGDPERLVASSEKIRSVLGWRPRFADPKAIIETAWNRHHSHPDGYRS